MISQDTLFNVTIELYNEKGSKFTMDELAKRLLISKKTLYEIVRSKDELAVQMVDYYFDQVTAIQDAIHEDKNLNPLEKFRKLLCATPDFPIRRYHLHDLEMNLPDAYQQLNSRLFQGWERTIGVLNQAKTSGLVKEDVDVVLFSKIYAAAIEEVLMGNEIKTSQAFKLIQEQIVELLLTGIAK